METVASKDDLLHLDVYVKWPQLEDALISTSRPTSRSSYCSENPSNSHRDSQSGSQPNSRPGSRQSSSNRGGSAQKRLYPSDSCLQRLRDLGMVAERQAALMDALDLLRVGLFTGKMVCVM